MRLHSKADFERFRAESEAAARAAQVEVRVCCGTGCRANGSLALAAELQKALAGEAGQKLSARVKRTGCHGFCERGPLVVVEPAGTLYTKVAQKDALEIVEKTLGKGEVLEKLLYKNPATKKSVERVRDIPFYREQTRVAMRNIGEVDPTSLADAVARGAWAGAVRALFELSPEQVLDEVEKSGLRGRGGAGFPTARKWRSARKAKGSRKFVLCNGDEGDPGAFKDRSLMEGDPQAVLEGLLIGAFAVGAHEAFIYVRDEYPLAVENLTLAIAAAREAGLLGKDILGTGFDLEVKLSRGGGAFVCGESSALMRSIEGKTGEPRVKYVHATDRGLFDCPTVLNNVETWAHVGAILARGAAWFAAMGTATSKGTKAFSLVGKVKNTGLIELPMGTPLRRILFDLGGGIAGDRKFKAVQTGGPSGGCLPESQLDLPVDYEKLTAAGSMMGSGGMIVMDDRTCMVDVARYFLSFLVEESCGKCTPCREGLRQMLAMLEALEAGTGKPEDLGRIEELAKAMQLSCLCELGKSAPNPVLSTLRYFRDEYLAHAQRGECPAGTCRALTRYFIDEAACNGCRACARACPAGAIEGAAKKPQKIDPSKCIACGACFEACRPGAVRFGPKSERKAAADAHPER